MDFSQMLLCKTNPERKKKKKRGEREIHLGEVGAI